MRTATITKIKGPSIQTQQNTFVLFTLFKLTKKQGENPPLKGKQQVTEKSCLQNQQRILASQLELTGLLVNIQCFMQLLHNRYFEVLVDHKVIEYMIKSKTESPTTRLKTLLLKLSEYTIELKYQKGSEMHTSDALS